MRDLVLTCFLLGALPFAVRFPVFGVFLWVWVSVMNPHRLTWSWAYEWPFAMLIAVATLIGVAFTREPKKFPARPITVVLITLTFWMCVTTAFAFDFDSAALMWEKVMKTMLMVFVTLFLLHTRRHVLVLVWIVTLSVAFFGVKGGIFTIVGGGVERVYGPPGSFIQENNSLALATIMTIPLLWFLRTQVRRFWQKWAFLVAMVLCGFSALGSHSRGALLAIAAMLAYFWLKSRAKIMTALLLAMVVPVAIMFMPEKWDERMRTIETYEEDSSAMGRLNAWQMNVNIANDRPLIGGGFELYNAEVFARYAPNPTDIHVAHSIYFQMLGEHGYVGFLLFVLLGILSYREASWIIRNSSRLEEWQSFGEMARMIQVSMVGYGVGGAFLSLAYYDVPYYLIAALVTTRVLMEKELAKRVSPGKQPRWNVSALHEPASRSTANPRSGKPRTSPQP